MSFFSGHLFGLATFSNIWQHLATTLIGQILTRLSRGIFINHANYTQLF
jgi:hypothetical protein